MPSLSELYIIFENLLLCENIVVLAKNPQTCSQFCSALIDLIRPIPYAGETRPYITMQSDFFTSGFQGGAPNRFVVGITNPFLLQRLSTLSGAGSGTVPHMLCLQNNERSIPIKREKSLRHRNTPAFDIPGAGGLAPPTATKKYLKVDSSFVQQLDSLLKDESAFEEIGPFVRRHFAELTAQFLAPFSRYFAASMSPSVATPGGNLAYANFSEADFLQSLSKHGTSAKFRGQNHFQRHKARDALYGSFCRSPNFYSWLEMKFSLEKEASAGLLG
ncbi:hypothetical protein W97_04670 [Coniosporium apollinis CBS 100218]|uniref:UDENN domain-containing protein n=1 Tax=Coniosporium apollinis (strain CBS 100218) TaxID=1168221 RepID=R7YU41_CONA1|nr:uncharacterized protein W97_04670 [Coniosporium apollinis CBS 100218]EON65432.1 hypothetical protein W97_04670 [Coniosporium apollinis CBS 100218]